MKKTTTVLYVTGFLSIAAITALNLFADEGVEPVITFEAASRSTLESLQDFPTAYRGEVNFTHAKHIQSLQGDCGKCHHDEGGDPVSDADEANEAGSCADCHQEEGLLRGKALSAASPDEILEHTPNAMHQLCVGCHKTSNNKAQTLSAPEACRTCHKKIDGD